MIVTGRNLQIGFRGVIALRAYEEIGFFPVPTNDNTTGPLLVKRTSSPYSPTHRKERYRDTGNLKRSQVDNLFDADNYANQIGLPLNRFVSVAWLLTGSGQLDAEVWQIALKRISQWVRDQSGKMAFVYTHENPVSTLGDEKPNSHILVHLPKHISTTAFSRQVEKAFEALDGGVDVQPRTFGKNPDTRLQYMTKGASQQTCWAHGGRRKKGGQGIIEIKRCGTSQNIGRAARKAVIARKIDVATRATSTQ